MKLLRITLLVLMLSAAFIGPQTLVLGNGLPFNDIEGSYAKDAILRLTEKNMMNGTSDSTFSPTRSITRAEFLITLNRVLGLEPVPSQIAAYKDVKRTDWYYSGIQAATEVGLTEGLGDGTFAPKSPVSRQEAAVWLQQMTGADPASAADIQAHKYLDHDVIAIWAKGAVYAATKLELMQGSDGRFDPQRALSRQEAAVILDRLIQTPSWSAKLAAKVQDGIQLGWQYRQSDAEFKQSVLASNVNVLSPRWFFLEQDGAISERGNTGLADWAHLHKKQVWAMFGNRINQEYTQTLLSSSAKTSAAITKIVQLAQKYGIDGINLDFENVAPDDRQAFTVFVTNLAKQLHDKGMVLSVDVSPDLGTDWTEGFDYAAIGKQADFVILMGYDEHWSGGAAGSVASLPWVQSGLDTLLKAVPASKVILGMPLYTRDWNVNRSGDTLNSEDLTLSEQMTRVSSLGLRPGWNSKLGQYITSYTSGSKTRQVWLEDSRSLSLKYKIALDRDIAGLAYWHIGGDTPEIWPSLRNMVKYHAIKQP